LQSAASASKAEGVDRVALGRIYSEGGQVALDCAEAMSDTPQASHACTDRSAYDAKFDSAHAQQKGLRKVPGL